jgi:hypothetical protein
MSRPLALVLLPWLLAACALFRGDEPKVESAPPGIGFRVEKSDGAGAAAKAAEYCGRYGKTAKEGKSTPTAEGSIASFECR